MTTTIHIEVLSTVNRGAINAQAILGVGDRLARSMRESLIVQGFSLELRRTDPLSQVDYRSEVPVELKELDEAVKCQP